jgi:hypothetical protein
VAAPVEVRWKPFRQAHLPRLYGPVISASENIQDVTDRAAPTSYAVWEDEGIFHRMIISPRSPVARWIMILGALTAGVRGEIEFVGIMATSRSSHYALGDTTTGKTDWVVPGATFAGHTVVSYDPKSETILLRRDATELRVRLKDDAKVKAARLELTGSIAFGATEKIEIERATLQFDQENVFPLHDGITYRITPTRLPDGTIQYRAEIERILGPNKTEKVSSPAVTTLPGQQFSMRIDDFGFSFKPR